MPARGEEAVSRKQGRMPDWALLYRLLDKNSLHTLVTSALCRQWSDEGDAADPESDQAMSGQEQDPDFYNQPRGSRD